MEIAVEALQRGAGDFIQKPWDNAALRRVLHTQLALGRARRMARRESRQNEREWEEAKEIQQGMLPRMLPDLAGFELAAAYRPARELAGDYYAVLPLDAKRALVLHWRCCRKGSSRCTPLNVQSSSGGEKHTRTQRALL